MLAQFRNWSIKVKIMLILLVSICMFTVAVETIFVPFMLRYLMNERQNATRQVVEVAFGILKREAQNVQDRLETSDEAKIKAISLIKSLRFRGEEIFLDSRSDPPCPQDDHAPHRPVPRRQSTG